MKRIFQFIGLAALALALMVPALAAQVEPNFVGGNANCSTVGSAGSQLTIFDPVQSGVPYTSGDFSVTLTGVDRRGFDKFETNGGLVYDVIVKGSGSHHYDYDGDPEVGPVTSDEDLVIPNGNKLNLIHFCFDPNLPPVAVDDSANTVAPDEVSIDVLANDSADSVSITNLTQPTSDEATTSIVGGEVVYDPNGFTGIDTFTYTANDGSLDSNVATVTVTVFEGQIGCGGSESLGDGAFVVNRGDDLEGEPEGVTCKGAGGQLAFTFDQGSGDEEDPFALFVDFVASDTGPTNDNVARFIETISWNLDFPGEGDPQYAPLYYDDHVNAGLRLMPWCEEDLWDDDTGLPVFPGEGETPIPAGHTSCLIHSETTSTGTGLTSLDYVYTEVDGFRAK